MTIDPVFKKQISYLDFAAIQACQDIICIVDANGMVIQCQNCSQCIDHYYPDI